VSRLQAAAEDVTRYGRRRCYYGRAPPLLRLLLVLLCIANLVIKNNYY